jgi:endonuclease/exonuclease/phosphatase (EEP) superfamily protein YafD
MCRSVLTAAALALAAWQGAPASGQEAGTPLRVLTWNIYWKNADLDATAKIILTVDADVVLLQETNGRLEAFFIEKLKDRYPHTHFHGHQGLYGAERFGLLSKAAVDEVGFLPPRHGLFGFQVTRIKIGAQNVQLVNVHLQPVVLEPGAGIAQAAHEFLRAETIHGEEIRSLLTQLDDSPPTIVAGDFNSMSPFIAPTTLRQKGFIDTFAAVNEQPDAHPTFRVSLQAADFTARIDYIFCSKHFSVRASRIVESDASDHLPVVSDLTLLDEPAR